ncbi:DNA translocase FtsK [Agaricicola taiwanensis]|uniref:DNA translocase FtsK n=1 Tax=Agaricicola taiwanensis TaxID=591372 RepID=A0A8J2VFK9_9RHOB|nr:DNA translocase FtsK [Agaricicola taiwanensis]
MRALTSRRRGYSNVAPLPDHVRDALRRRAVELGGLALLALGSLVGAALATWSAQDPSVNHAASGTIHNLLGAPGAITADVLMQLFGLGSIALLLPVACWGWRLVTHRPVDRERLRLGAWAAAVALASAFCSSLPKAAGWPLPSGLGGVAGDGLAALPIALIGQTGSSLMIVVWGLGAIAALLVASNLVLTQSGQSATDRRSQPRSKPAKQRPEEEDDGDTDGFMPLGLLAHWWFTLRGAVARKMRGGALRRSPTEPRRAGLRDVFARLGEEPEDDFAPMRPLKRVSMPAEPAPAAYGYDEEDEDLDDLPPLELKSQPQVSSRVTPVKAAPKPGKRIVKEAQASLLRDDNTYELPPLALLAAPKKNSGPTVSAEALEQNARLLEGVLDDFGVKGQIINVRPGPVVTLYELEPAPGVKSSRVIGLADDIARSMSAVSARVAVVPGRNAIGIELPNSRRETVYLRELLASADFENAKMRLPLCLGKTIGGESVIAELARMPHLLIAGTTGSGKSVAINTMILSLLYRLTPDQCRLIMVDPKMLELSIYDGIPHLLTPVVTDPKKAVVALKWAVREMEERYKKMSKLGVRNIDGFNSRVQQAKDKGEIITRTVQTGFDRETGEAIYEHEDMDLEPLPFIVVIVDEMADLMMVAGKEIEGTIQRLAQMARAAGIHVVLATQRPSVDVITGTIKANFPTRISFQVTSKIDSRTILGEQGAEQLLGQGDMLHMAGGGRIARVHGPFVSDEEVEQVVAHLKAQGTPDYLDAVTEEEEQEGDGDGAVFDKTGMGGDPEADLYDQAVAVVLRDKKASTSYIQRRLQIGYNRAATLIERMENEGIVGPANHAGKRDILVGKDDAA